MQRQPLWSWSKQHASLEIRESTRKTSSYGGCFTIQRAQLSFVMNPLCSELLSRYINQKQLTFCHEIIPLSTINQSNKPFPALSNYWRAWLMLMCAVKADVDRCSWYQKCIESQLTVVERKGSWEEISSSSPQAGIWLEQIGLCLLLCVSEPVSVGSVEVWLSLNADSRSSGSVKAPYVLCHTNWEHLPGISSFTFSPGCNYHSYPTELLTTEAARPPHKDLSLKARLTTFYKAALLVVLWGDHSTWITRPLFVGKERK